MFRCIPKVMDPETTSVKRPISEDTSLTKATETEDRALISAKEGSAENGIKEAQLQPKAADANIGFFFALFVSILNFLKPYYDTLKEYESIETVLNFIERIAKRLQVFFQKHDHIWEITWSEVKELIKEVRDFFSGDNAPTKLMTKLWWKAHLAVIKSLENVERIHEYVIPLLEGVEPLFVIDRTKKYPIRDMCFYINMNFIHRVFVLFADASIVFLERFLTISYKEMTESAKNMEMPTIDEVSDSDGKNMEMPTIDEVSDSDRKNKKVRFAVEEEASSTVGKDSDEKQEKGSLVMQKLKKKKAASQEN